MKLAQFAAAVCLTICIGCHLPDTKPDAGGAHFAGGAPIGLPFAWEPHVAVCPTDPSVVAVGDGFTLLISHDAGATFPITIGPAIPTGYQGACGDGVLTFDSHGRLYWSYLACQPIDGGPGWNPVVAQVDPGSGNVLSHVAIPPDTVANQWNDDKPWIAADWTDGPHSDSIYLVWSRNYKDARGWAAMFSRSTDHGLTWSAPANLSAADEGMRWPTHVAVAPNGDVYVSYLADAGSGAIHVVRSTQGGDDFILGNVEQRAVALIETYPASNPPPPGNNFPGVLFGIWPSASVAPDPSRPGVVYVVGQRSPSTVPGDPGDVLFARSSDHGKTWTQSNPFDDQTGQLQAFPSLAVDTGGTVVVSWYDTRSGTLGASEELLLHRYAAVSKDGGHTFAPSAPISPTPFDPGSSDRIGEYFGLAAGHGNAYAVWTGNGLNTADWQVAASADARW